MQGSLYLKSVTVLLSETKMKTTSHYFTHYVEIIMRNASCLEPFHNNIGKKKKTTYKHNQYFAISVGKHHQYIQHERWLPPHNEPRKSELKTQIRRYKAVKRATL